MVIFGRTSELLLAMVVLLYKLLRGTGYLSHLIDGNCGGIHHLQTYLERLYCVNY